MDYLASVTCRDGSILQHILNEKSGLSTPNSSHKNVMSDTGQRGRLVYNEQFTLFYGSVPLANTPNLHAGSSQAEMRKEWKLRCSLFPSLPLWPFLVFFLTD
jgi:hypothetical protein